MGRAALGIGLSRRGLGRSAFGFDAPRVGLRGALRRLLAHPGGFGGLVLGGAALGGESGGLVFGRDTASLGFQGGPGGGFARLRLLEQLRLGLRALGRGTCQRFAREGGAPRFVGGARLRRRTPTI